MNTPVSVLQALRYDLRLNGIRFNAPGHYNTALPVALHFENIVAGKNGLNGHDIGETVRAYIPKAELYLRSVLPNPVTKEGYVFSVLNGQLAAGLYDCVRLYEKLRKLLPQTRPELITNLPLQEQLIRQYIESFFQAISTMEQDNISPRIGLDVAKRSYAYAPTALLELHQKFPSVPAEAIAFAMATLPTDAASTIAQIETAAREKYTNPIARLEHLKRLIKRATQPEPKLLLTQRR